MLAKKGLSENSKKIKKCLIKDYKDKNYISIEPDHQKKNRELEDKNKISNDDIHGYVLGETNVNIGDNQKRNIWDKTKKRYVYASANELKLSKRRVDKEDRGNKDKVATRDYSRWKR